MTTREDEQPLPIGGARPDAGETGARSRRWLLPIFVAALLLRLFALWALPLAKAPDDDPNYAPDEFMHIEEVHLLANGQLLHWPDGTGSIYAAFPPSQDAPQVVTLWIGKALHLLDFGARFPPRRPLAEGYPWARLGSALVSALTCILLGFAVSRATGRSEAGMLVALCCALHPQLIFPGAYVNPDAFSVCACSALAAALAHWLALGEGDLGLRWVGAALGVVIATKVSGYFILLPTGVWLLWSVAQRRIHLQPLFAAIGIALAICVPPLALNAARNHGDPFGIATYATFMQTVWAPLSHRWGDTPNALGTALTVLPESAYGVFGNLTLFLPSWQYRAFTILLCLGVGAAGLSPWRAGAPAKRASAWILAVILSNCALVLYNMWFVDYQAQGRYILFSGLLLLALALSVPRRRGWPGRALSLGLVLVLAASTVSMQQLIYLRGR